MKCTILGCGSSRGVPEVACSCYVCSSKNKKDKRTRSSILIESEKTKIIVDTSPDLRQQLLSNNISKIDCVLYTHAHFDHIAGADDLKPIIQLSGYNKIPAFMHNFTKKMITTRLNYAFNDITEGYSPFLDLQIFRDDLFWYNDIAVQPFLQQHGTIYSSGFRFGELAYSTDVHYIEEKYLHFLYGIKIWIISCMRYFGTKTHFGLEAVMQYIEKIKPDFVILTHMGHNLGYDELCYLLPKNIRPAYDGMSIVFNK